MISDKLLIMEKDFPLSFECEHSHRIRDWSGKCERGHEPFYRVVECPVKLCGFHAKSGFVDAPIDKGWTQVRDHFLEAHGYRLQSEVLKQIASGQKVVPVEASVNDTKENVIVDKNDALVLEASVTDKIENVIVDSEKGVSEVSNELDGIQGVDNEDAEKLATIAETSTTELLSCSLCFKRMKTMFSLKRHIKQVHELDERFECEHCTKTFCAQASLDYHIKKMHSAGTEIICENVARSFLILKAIKHLKLLTSRTGLLNVTIVAR